MATHSRDRVKRTKPARFMRTPTFGLASFVYTKWFAYSGIATFVASLFISWYLLSPVPVNRLTHSDEEAVDLDRTRENSEMENDPQLWAVKTLADALIIKDMDSELQPINDVGSEYISLVDEL